VWLDGHQDQGGVADISSSRATGGAGRQLSSPVASFTPVGPVRQTAPWYATGGDVGNVGSNGRGEPRQKSTPSNGYPWPRTCCIRGSEEMK